MLYRNSRLSKIRTVHTYVMPRTVYFGCICMWSIQSVCKSWQKSSCLLGSETNIFFHALLIFSKYAESSHYLYLLYILSLGWMQHKGITATKIYCNIFLSLSHINLKILVLLDLSLFYWIYPYCFWLLLILIGTKKAQKLY